MSREKSQTSISNSESFDKFQIFVWKSILYTFSLSLIMAPIILLFNESFKQDEGKGTQIIIIFGSLILSALFFLAAKYYFTLSGVKKRRLTASPEYQQKMLDESIKQEELRRSKYPHQTQTDSLPFLSVMLGYLVFIGGLLLLLLLLIDSSSWLLVLPISIVTVAWGGLTIHAVDLEGKKLSDSEFKFFSIMKGGMELLDALMKIVLLLLGAGGGIILIWKLVSLVFNATGSVLITVVIILLLTGGGYYKSKN